LTLDIEVATVKDIVIWIAGEGTGVWEETSQQDQHSLKITHMSDFIMIWEAIRGVIVVIDITTILFLIN
jgi:hypothetical protein